jgi:hypothetical protein
MNNIMVLLQSDISMDAFLALKVPFAGLRAVNHSHECITNPLLEEKPPRLANENGILFNMF